MEITHIDFAEPGAVAGACQGNLDDASISKVIGFLATTLPTTSDWEEPMVVRSTSTVHDDEAGQDARMLHQSIATLLSRSKQICQMALAGHKHTKEWPV